MPKHVAEIAELLPADISIMDNLRTLISAFSIARIVGWTAHVLEQQGDNVIFRPQSEYIGN